MKLQDKIDNMSLAKRPTEVRLKPDMVEEFKKSVMVAQVPEPQ
jgi:NADH-quinone oxidoreductase subunit B